MKSTGFNLFTGISPYQLALAGLPVVQVTQAHEK
jgi:hypothetical protein